MKWVALYSLGMILTAAFFVSISFYHESPLNQNDAGFAVVATCLWPFLWILVLLGLALRAFMYVTSGAA